MGILSLLQDVDKGDASLERRSHPAGIIRFFRLGLTILHIIIGNDILLGTKDNKGV